MSRIAFCGDVVLPTRVLIAGIVLVADGRIVDVLSAGDVRMPDDALVVEARDGYISPGFSTFIRMAAPAATTWMARPTRFALPTAHMPATARRRSFRPPPLERRRNLRAMLDAVEHVARRGPVPTARGSAACTGTGRISPATKIGAHPKGFERNPDPAEYEPALARGIIKSATCAAELPGAVEFCRAAKAAGCLVTCGHSERILARDGGGLRRRHAPRRSFLERHEQHRFDSQTIGHAPARQHGGVCALSSRDEHRGDRGRLSSRPGDAAIRLSDEGAGTLVPGERLQPGTRHAAGNLSHRPSPNGRTFEHNGVVACFPGPTSWPVRFSRWNTWCRMMRGHRRRLGRSDPHGLAHAGGADGFCPGSRQPRTGQAGRYRDSLPGPARQSHVYRRRRGRWHQIQGGVLGVRPPASQQHTRRRIVLHHVGIVIRERLVRASHASLVASTLPCSNLPWCDSSLLSVAQRTYANSCCSDPNVATSRSGPDFFEPYR